MNVRQVIQDFILRITPAGNFDTTSEPLLSQQEIDAIRVATTHSLTTTSVDHEVQHSLLGERLSSYSGSGYEFAENRNFVAGDNARFINWRQYARTGELYKKVFHEERRPQVWLLVDKRHSMCFGTQHKLKATQAVIYAIEKLFEAQQHLMESTCIIIDSNPVWNTPTSNNTDLSFMIKQLVAPCSSGRRNNSEPPLNSILKHMLVQMIHGSIIYIISDFHDLDNSSRTTLQALSEYHTIHAAHIIDPVEASLPTSGKFHIYDELTDDATEIDCNDEQQRNRLNQQLTEKLELIETYLKQANTRYTRLVTRSSDSID